MLFRKLILNNDNFPSAFNDIENIEETDIIKRQSLIEKLILKKINDYNSKLCVSEILYEDLNNQFNNIHTSKYTGAIVEDISIDADNAQWYKKHNYFVFTNNEAVFARKIIEYVFISLPKESSRNIFCAQIFFPTIIDYMKTYISSPSYSAANHKFMFINIVNKKITANSILRPLALLSKIGMDYVEIFQDMINISEIPNNLKSFLKLYDKDYDNFYNNADDTYVNDYYFIDFKNKLFKIKVNYINDNIELNEQKKYDFKGSSEKFFWIVIYPITIFAYQLGYKIDYSEYVDFCTNYKTKFKNNSEKFSRCEFLILYFNKYFN